MPRAPNPSDPLTRPVPATNPATASRVEVHSAGIGGTIGTNGTSLTGMVIELEQRCSDPARPRLVTVGAA